MSETNPAGAKAVAVAAKAARRTTLLRILFSSAGALYEERVTGLIRGG